MNSTIHRFSGLFHGKPALQRTMQYLLVLVFYIGLFFLVSFFSKAMPVLNQVSSVKSTSAHTGR